MHLNENCKARASRRAPRFNVITISEFEAAHAQKQQRKMRGWFPLVTALVQGCKLRFNRPFKINSTCPPIARHATLPAGLLARGRACNCPGQCKLHEPISLALNYGGGHCQGPRCQWQAKCTRPTQASRVSTDTELCAHTYILKAMEFMTSALDIYTMQNCTSKGMRPGEMCVRNLRFRASFPHLP